MAATLTLKIITPERVVLDKPVEQVVARGMDGEFSILPGHEPFVSTLAIDVLRFIANGEEDAAAIMGGVLEVRNNEITVISDVAELDADIDEARAKQAKERAEAEKTQKKDNVEVYVSELALSKAMARLKAAELIKERKRMRR
jgi:F-type H+-transporting ATPase subunit epsilon